jgi:diaminohydroxyphosphoribosylaminopyrimidine deaminase/5-amino-6-(5-phosphoribosylamino)uracil reductase
MIDPNPLVAGKGIERLRQAGMEVVVGIEEEDCRQLNEAFIYWIRHQRPFGILKYAMTLDGKIAAKTGDSYWVTGTAARHLVHQVRGACDAVIVGGNTVRQDNPHLTAHGASPHNPLRVVMSRSLNLPAEAHIWNVAEAPTLLLAEAGSRLDFQEFLRQKGVEVVELMSLSPATAMKYLYERELCSVLWECGGILAAKAIAEGAVQKVMAFITPKIIGGQTAPSPVGDLSLEKMGEALVLQRIKMQQIEADFLVEGYL